MMKNLNVTLVAVVLATLNTESSATDVSIRQEGSQVIVTWPQIATSDFYLQVAKNLTNLTAWYPATGQVAAVGSFFQVTNAISEASRFYRLQAWEILFDGTAVSAFRGYQQSSFPDSSVWAVNANGEMETVVGGASVDIVPTNQYADFELVWEWKADAGGNSGVNYRATEQYASAERSGPEYQLLDDAKYTGLAAKQGIGAVWDLVAPANKTLLPAGNWNQCGVIVQSNHVEHWLNGTRVLSYDLNSSAFAAVVSANAFFKQYPQFAKARSGHIALRHEQKRTWYRNIKIRPLPPQ